MLSALATEPRTRRHTIMQGESEVSSDQRLVLSTVLGSCIACCLFDPTLALGGMNHFLLPTPPEGRGEDRDGDRGEAERYGIYAMEVLVNAMLTRGASRATMRAHLYGGANLHEGMRAIGSKNAQFARDFLAADRIQLVREDTGGVLARRLELQPASGRVRCRHVAEHVPDGRPAAPPPSSGHVELF